MIFFIFNLIFCNIVIVVKADDSFTFETANGLDHPDFVLDILENRGPILIMYGEKACAACDDMIYNVIQPYFEIEFDNTISGDFDIDIRGLDFTYVYIYFDDPVTSKERIDSFDIYDIRHVKRFPMFVVITIGNDGGVIKPYYTTLYGKFEENNNYPKMAQTFNELIVTSMEFYDEYSDYSIYQDIGVFGFIRHLDTPFFLLLVFVIIIVIVIVIYVVVMRIKSRKKYLRNWEEVLPGGVSGYKIHAKFCSHCGHKVENIQIFCPVCGNRI
jgi:hypothetical protein